MPNKKMICPDCGVEMNHHAEKINYGAAMEGSAAVDRDFGGVLEEVYACPRCGRTGVRPAAGTNDAQG